MLEGEGISFAYLSGKQSTEQRNKAVEGFQKENNEVKVLVSSMRAGGQCLNLTRGNRVVLMELWWNHAAEQQAFARVFRYGQKKQTHFVRFIVQTPIEQRMLEMQAEKILEIDEALQDDGRHSAKVNVVDIAGLLGKVIRDDDGTHKVVADYSDLDGDDDTSDGATEEEPDLPDLVVPDDEVEYEDEDAEDGAILIEDDSDDSM